MIERIDAQIAQLLQAQAATDAKQEQMGERSDQLSNRVNEFIFHTQRVFTQTAGTLERVQGQSDKIPPNRWDKLISSP